MKKIFRIISILTILTVISVGLFLVLKYRGIATNQLSKDSTEIKYTIKEGMTGDMVVDELSALGVIPSNDLAYVKVYMRLNKVDTFKVGQFTVPKNLTLAELFETFKHPESTDFWVTIPEGLRYDEIANRLDEKFKQYPNAVFNKATFLKLCTDKTYIATLGLKMGNLKTLEGVLFPDRYLLPIEADEKYVINTLVNTFLLKTGGQYSYKEIIIASMLEREGKNSTDRKMISDIIQRRLKEGWLLQIDATLLYYHKDWKHVITQEDKQIDHKYNTYKKAGLIPTPICNSGLSSLTAVKNPTSNSYYYYIHDNTGKAHYATTYDQHLVNVNTYLR